MDPHLKALAMKELEGIEIRERMQLSFESKAIPGASQWKFAPGMDIPDTFDADALFVATGLCAKI